MITDQQTGTKSPAPRGAGARGFPKASIHLSGKKVP